ncbi:hypothetical protein I3900191A7_14500 [Clostridium baratii]|uniref:DUF4145 domain-containing protein n=1 Tax=Clostridium baratii TaxID=1561 RepID=UPI0036F367A9
MEKRNLNWANTSKLNSRSYICGYCGEKIASNEGYYVSNSAISGIYICHNCSNPTYFSHDNNQFPGSKYGDNIEYLSEEVEELYNEAKNCFSVNAFTSSILCCRKLLMNCAVDQGAEEGKQFVYYINYLEDNNYTPKNIKDCIDEIRKLGNEGTHKIKSKTREEAELAIDFTALVLQMVYEAPGKLKSKINKND